MEITSITRDEDGNHSRLVEIYAYLALIDDVPLLLGFKDLLQHFKVCFDYNANKAFIEVKED